MMMVRHLMFFAGISVGLAIVRLPGIFLAAMLSMGPMACVGMSTFAASHSAVAAVHEEHQECKSDKKNQS